MDFMAISTINFCVTVKLNIGEKHVIQFFSLIGENMPDEVRYSFHFLHLSLCAQGA